MFNTRIQLNPFIKQFREQERCEPLNADLILSAPVLTNGFLSLEGVLGPNSLRVDELTLPRLDVSIQVRNELVFFVAHSRPEVGDSHVGLLRPPVAATEN